MTSRNSKDLPIECYREYRGRNFNQTKLQLTIVHRHSWRVSTSEPFPYSVAVAGVMELVANAKLSLLLTHCPLRDLDDCINVESLNEHGCLTCIMYELMYTVCTFNITHS